MRSPVVCDLRFEQFFSPNDHSRPALYQHSKLKRVGAADVVNYLNRLVLGFAFVASLALGHAMAIAGGFSVRMPSIVICCLNTANGTFIALCFSVTFCAFHNTYTLPKALLKNTLPISLPPSLHLQFFLNRENPHRSAATLRISLNRKN